MLKFKTSCAVLANLSSNLLKEVGLSLFRYFKVGLRVCDIVVNKFTFAISSPDEFLYFTFNSAIPISYKNRGIFYGLSHIFLFWPFLRCACAEMALFLLSE